MIMIDFDALTKKYNKLGIPTPAKRLIKTPEQIEGIRKAGIINTQVLDEVAKNIKAGMSTEDINIIVHNKTIELGGIPAPLGYEGFPKSCCTSVNDEVCHGIPSEDCILKNGDIINVDCTTIYNGYYADASRMFCIGQCSNEALNLVKVCKESLDLAVKELKPFSRLRDIGYNIETHVKANGYSVVHEIGGHGVGNDFHEEPFVYHFGKKGTGMVLFPGMVITIEPMVNEASRHVFLDADNNWTIYTEDGGLSAQYEYTVLIKEDGIEILAY
ncbi:MAG: type I methionyl aminopeptidase [Erysipelotrichaceae bacterium]|nr:type I methionyl aminopeptidase [Erysipelotrichaceae bacterium]